MLAMLATKLIHGCYSEKAREKVFSEHPDCAPDLDLVRYCGYSVQRKRLKGFKHSAKSSSEVLMVKHKDQPVQPQTSEGLSKNGPAKCG